MDKYEYKIRTEEIKELIARKEYAEAAEIADTIDWRRVKSVMMLCTISDLYKINRRYEDSMDLLLLAYERHPGGRTIVYSLCELAIKMGNYAQALEYCREFVQIAPRDSGRYILQYKLYEAQDVSLEERIAVLEELKKRDYREKWAYELAYLYHRVGLATKCVEECDELIVWFGDGKYVIKAMELKMLHQPLTPEQQRKYDMRFGGEEMPEAAQVQEEDEQKSAEDAVLTAATTRIPSEELDIHIKTMGLERYDTINLQAEVAAGVKEFLEKQADSDAGNEKQEAYQASEEVFFETPAEGEEEESEISTEPVQETGKKEEPADPIAETVMEQIRQEKQDEPPKEMARVLSMEADGQISFVVPEKEAIEKQITGQISITDIMAEWERMKKELEEKHEEKVRKLVLQNTDAMFTEFEESVRDGLLEQLESGRDIEEVLAEAEGRNMAVGEAANEPVQAEEDPTESLQDTGMTELFGFVEPSEEEEALGEVEELSEIEEYPEEENTEEAEEFSEEEYAEEAEEFSEEEDTEEAEEFSEEEYTGEAEESSEEEYTGEAEEFSEEEYTGEAEESSEEEDTEEAEEFSEEEYTGEAEESSEEEYAGEAEESSEEEYAEEAEGLSGEEYAEEEKHFRKEDTDRTRQGRSLTREEKELFGPYIQGRLSREQIINTIDNISLAAYTGNVIITGAEGLDTLGLAKNIIRQLQLTDSNFSGKIAKISGETLNKRDAAEVLKGLNNGALIIQHAGVLNKKTANGLYKALQREEKGIVVVLEGTKKTINALLKENSALESCFTARIDMEALSDAALVAFGKKYARENEHSIDELGILALHRTITERQTSDHVVTISEVKEIIDDAIESADSKTIGHFFAILTSKRYDEEDMIIIREKDFD